MKGMNIEEAWQLSRVPSEEQVGWRGSHSPFCCRASWRLVSMSCSVAARFRGRLPVPFWVSRALFGEGLRPRVAKLSWEEEEEEPEEEGRGPLRVRGRGLVASPSILER